MSYDLKTILSTVCTYKKNKDKSRQVKKRLLYDQGPVGGLSNKVFLAFFIALPFIEYAIIFNPYVFETLGIAQAIVFFIVFLSMVMIFIFMLSWFNNHKVEDDIRPLWEGYFPDIDLKLVLNTGASPYKEFFNEYGMVAGNDLSDEQLHQELKEAFLRMQEKNKDLLEAMSRDKNRG